MARSDELQSLRRAHPEELVLYLIASIAVHFILLLANNYWLEALKAKQKQELSQAIPIDYIEIPPKETKTPPETSRRAVKDSVAGGEAKKEIPVSAGKSVSPTVPKAPTSKLGDVQALESVVRPTTPPVSKPAQPKVALKTTPPLTEPTPTEVVPEPSPTVIEPKTTPPIPEPSPTVIEPKITPPIPEPSPTPAIRKPLPRLVVPETIQPTPIPSPTAFAPKITPPEPQPRVVLPQTKPSLPKPPQPLVVPTTTPPISKPSTAVAPKITPLPTSKPSTAVVPNITPLPTSKPSTAVVPKITPPPTSKPSTAVVPKITPPPTSKPSQRIVTRPTTSSAPSPQDNKNRFAARSTSRELGTQTGSTSRTSPPSQPSQQSGAASTLGGPVTLSQRNFHDNSHAALPNSNRLNQGLDGIDAQKDDLGPYLAQLQQKVRQQWIPGHTQSSRRTVLFFTITRSGQVMNLEILRSSGFSSTDEEAVKAVSRAAPFLPLPPTYEENYLNIEFTFNINIYGQLDLNFNKF